MSVLYVVATPIGNLKDLSFRALEVLQQVDWIAVEDTRVSSKLLSHYGIKKPLIPYHQYNEEKRLNYLISLLQKGDSIALISDAGTPLISDPGYKLVVKLQILGIKVIAVPGPSAVISALSISGLPTDRFIFEGFLPVKHGEKISHLSSIKDEVRTMIFFEAPHRLYSTLTALAEVFSVERSATLVKEITKIHETVIRGNLNELLSWVDTQEKVLGEFVIVVSGKKATEFNIEDKIEKLLIPLLKEVSLKTAVELVQTITGAERNLTYKLANILKNKQ